MTVLTVPANVRVGIKAYYYSPDLAKVSFIEVDASPASNGEVGLDIEQIPGLDAAACDYLNCLEGVSDFRPASAAEVAEHVTDEADDFDEDDEVSAAA
jgi:hypothetical protein